MFSKIKNFFSLKNAKKWDSSEEFLKFFLGLVLAAALFSLIWWHAIRQISFLVNEGKNPALKIIDLTQNPQTEIPKGYVQITGYPSQVIKHMPTFGGEGSDFGVVPEYYYALLPKPQAEISQIKSEIVVVNGKNIGDGWKTREKLTVIGIIGYHAVGISFLNKKWFTENFGNGKNEILTLVEDARAPNLKILLFWLSPAFLGFCFGAALIWRWISLVRRFYHSP